MLADAFLSKPEDAMRMLFAAMQAEVLAAHENPPARVTYRDGVIVWKLHVDDVAHPHDFIDQEHIHVPIDFGCTAAVAAITPTSIICANAGDSAIMLCRLTMPPGYHATSDGDKRMHTVEAHPLQISPLSEGHALSHTSSLSEALSEASEYATRSSCGGDGGKGSSTNPSTISLDPCSHVTSCLTDVPHGASINCHSEGVGSVRSSPEKSDRSSMAPSTPPRAKLTVSLGSMLHRADQPTEQARILAITKDVGFEDGYLSPLKPPLSGSYLINTTRSLGHKVFRTLGVSSDPFVKIQEFSSADRVEKVFVVVCSDGVTDELTFTEIGHLVVEAKSAKSLAETMTDTAHHRGKTAGDADDCTVVCAFIDCS